MKMVLLGLMLSLAACASSTVATRAPEFVSLGELDPTIVIEMRYHGSHNFLGRPVKGYRAGKCLLTRVAAERLKALQGVLKPYGLGLKMYDCYRPQRAVDDFIAWARDPKDEKTKLEFYPRVNKKDVFKLGYVAEKSGHSRGSTVDLTLVPLPLPKQPEYRDGEKLFDCAAERPRRFADNSVDMGTGYDCFDERSSTAHPALDPEARNRRLLLKTLMEQHGFENYAGEWWHYTLKNEPFASTYFDFEVQ